MKNLKIILLFSGMMASAALSAQDAIWNSEKGNSPIWGESSATESEYFSAPANGPSKVPPGTGGDAIGVTPIHDTFLILFFIAGCYGAYGLKRRYRSKQLVKRF